MQGLAVSLLAGATRLQIFTKYSHSNFPKICQAFAPTLNKKHQTQPTALSMLAARLTERRPIEPRGKQGWVMFFLLRMTFWLGVVLVLLPIGSPQPVPESKVSAGEAIEAARAAVTDLQQFCERQPQACAVGSQTATSLGQRAQAGAKILYDFLSEQFGTPQAQPRVTGSIPLPQPKPSPSQNTLRPADLVPPWRGPQPVMTAGR